MSLANRKLQSGRPQMDTDDSGVSVSLASSTASSATQSASDAFELVAAFRIIFSWNILNNTGDNGRPGRTPTGVRKKSQHFHL